MQRDRVSRIRVYCEYVESLRWFSRKRRSRISGDYRSMRTGVAFLGEDVARDRLYCRIDVIELDVIAGFSISRDRSRPKPNYANHSWPSFTAESQRKPDA